MKIFLDTADVAEIREYAASGLVDGVTTNPSLAAKTGRDYVESLKEICAIVPGAVSGEVLATDFDGMMKEAAVLTKIAKNIAVKVPLTWDGLKACAALSKDGHMVNVTLCFSPVQAWMAAKAGATFISPFIGRVDDVGEDGMTLGVEVLRLEHVAHSGHRVAIDEDAAEHRLLGVVVVRRHPHRRARAGCAPEDLGRRDGRHWAATTTLRVSLTSGWSSMLPAASATLSPGVRVAPKSAARSEMEIVRPACASPISASTAPWIDVFVVLFMYSPSK